MDELSVSNGKQYCVSYTNNYPDLFTCPDDAYCCGKILHQKCCPKLPAGAIFGIVLSCVVVSAIVVCCIASCCMWCDCCLYRRERRNRKSRNRRMDIDEPPEETEGRPTREPLTLNISKPADATDVAEHTNSDGHINDVISVELCAPSTPLTPTTPLSISSPTEFSKLIIHDWNRLKTKTETSPFSDVQDPENT